MQYFVEPLERRMLLASSLHIDVGSKTGYVDSTGQTWTADTGFSGGTVSTNSVPVAGTADPALYVTRRWGNMSYALAVDNGAYNLSLYFTEPVMTKAGQRKFNVFAENAQILSNFDLFAAGAYHKSLIKDFPVTVSDGTLNLKFTSLINNAIVSAIQLTPVVSDGSIRINAGGPAQTVNGSYWFAGNTDSGPWGQVDSGFAYKPSPTPAITGADVPANQAIFQTEWTGGATTGQLPGQPAFTYHLPVGNGSWLVGLYFDELNKTAAGQRVFDVNINGQSVLQSFDVFAASGGEDRAIVREFAVDVSANMINIAFITEVENAKVSGIELIPQGIVGTVPPRTSLAWSAGSAASPIARYEPVSIQVGSKLFIMGGFTGFDLGVTSEVDIYDLASKTWTTGAPLPDAETHAAAASDGTYIYVAGGQVGGGEAAGTGTNEVWRYDIANDLWTPFTPLPDVRFGGTMKILNGVLNYAAGDLADRSTISTLHWAFDLNGGTQWTTLAAIPIGGDHLSSAVVNGEWYVIGGERDHGTLYTQQNYVFEYDPTSDTWTQKSNIPIARSHIEGSTLVINNNIYVMGGQTAHLGMTADVEEYDPINDVWWQLAAMPGVRKGAAGAYYNGQIVLIAGQSYYHVESGSYVTTVTNP